VDDPPQEDVLPRRRKRLVAPVILFLFVLALALLWALRLPIAADYLRREFDRRGVPATYEVKEIGFGRQRVENLVVGDRANPDLTARSVELRLSWGFRRPRITLITARGVRLKGRVVDGRISLGAVDRLLPPPTGAPFRFPDQAVDVADTTIRLDTPAGLVGLAVSGKGNLSGGFRGEMAAASQQLQLGSCALAGPRAYWKVAIDDARPSLAGPGRATSLACGSALALRQPRIDLQASLSEALGAWTGQAGIAAAGAALGTSRLGTLAGRISFEGDAAATKGAVDLAAASVRTGAVAAGRTRIDGRYSLSPRTGAFSLLADAGARGVSAPSTIAGLARALGSAGGTPVEAAGDALALALRRAAAGFDVAGSLRVVSGSGNGGVRFDRLIAVAGSGARLTLEGGKGVSYAWPSGATRIDGNVWVAGGGFPAIRLALSQPGGVGTVRGVGTVAPIAVGGSRLALGPVRFDAAPGGATSVTTTATIDGPFDDGDVRGLVVPVSGRIDGRGGFAFGENCVAARFVALRIATLRLGSTALPLCPTGRALLWKAPGGRVQGGATVRPVRLAGTLGATPLRLASSRLLFGFDGPSFTAADVAVALGRPGALNTMRLATFDGRFDRPGVGGAFTGMVGKLAAVPLDLAGGAGRWSVKDGELLVTGAMTVADTFAPARFYPLRTDDFRLTLADGVIRAGGRLTDPETGTRIAQVDISHALRTGAGRAVLDVPGIRFDKDYQPEQLTRLTTGVVALVNGVLTGRGEIGWESGRTTSSGTFSTEDMDFAAAFGPVEGLATTLRFTDLLGLSSAPGQLAQVGLVRTGIDVVDGSIRYQLLPGLRVKVEGGRWPFAGGELFLEETVLDFSKPTSKQLTFRVVGLDAALFVQKMEFSNISATGTFDGVIPMVFDQSGGRIVGGRLTARPEGGTLSYIGELTDKQLGVYGKLAFDALKSLRYSKLSIGLDGALDGEFVAGIELDGVARDPVLTTAPSGSGISGLVVRRTLGQLRKIPFEFNITVRGPFRSLLATMRSFEDPTNLIQSVLPEKLRPRDPLAPADPLAPVPPDPLAPDTPAAPPPRLQTVQPTESEIVR
jgi:hypothetical protein